MTLSDWCAQSGAQELLACYENGGNPLPPEEIGFSSPKVVRWNCSVCGLTWELSPNQMNRRRLDKTICPYCARKRASYFYNAAILYPELQPIWDLEANGTPLESYTPGTKKSAVWKCENGHRWTRPICDQIVSVQRHRKDAETSSKSFCPYCSHQRVSATYNLEVLFPDVSLQWDYSRNGSLTPRDVMPYSSQKVHWVCQFNPTHRWEDRIANRTLLLRGCPNCAKIFHTSYTARTLYFYLRQNNIDCTIEQPEGRYSIDIAVYLPDERPIALEIDGHYTHQSTAAQDRDKKKDLFLRKAGYRVVRIRDDPSYNGNIFMDEDTIVYPYVEQYGCLDALSEFLVAYLTGHRITADHTRDHWQIERMFYHDRKLRSLAVQYPELAAQWSPNNQEPPDVVLPGSSTVRLWICPTCKKEFRISTINRTAHKSGCPYCSNRIVTPESSLKGQFPQIALEWHAEKNHPLRPEEIAPHARRKVWWKCAEGHEWQASVDLRTRKNGTNCPVCQGRKVIPERSLAVHRPILVSFWHPDKNSSTIWETAPYSNKRYWWKCRAGHEWQASPQKLIKRADDRICPYCSKERAWAGYCLESHNRPLSAIWHPTKNTRTPQDTAPFSNIRVWWKCDAGHEWEEAVCVMQRFPPDKFCPYCANRRARSL